MAVSISLFSFENHPLRVQIDNDDPIFLARDLCQALGYKVPQKALLDHVDPCDVLKRNVTCENRIAGSKARRSQLMSWVNESGMYALIFGSKLPSAIKFKRWVTSEVLPAIRKTGRYEVVSRSKKPARSSGAVYVQKASPVVQAPAIPPLMRPLDRPIRSDSGSYYEVWELWHRKIGALGLVPDWSSGAETAAWLHVFKDCEGKVLFSMLDLCMMCGIDYHDPALNRMIDDGILVTGRVSELFDIPYTEKFLKLCGAENAVYIVKSSRSEVVREIGEWLFNTVFPCFGLSANLTRNALLRDYPQLVWAERAAM